MNSVPQHWSNEDRQAYERLLDEALRSAPHRSNPAVAGQHPHLTSEQLRTMALDATALITATAATEYQHYVTIREGLRHPAPSHASPVAGPEGPGADAVDPAIIPGEAPEAAGAGAVAVVAVLAPMLSGTAAAIFLLVGYVLRMITPEQTFARTMLTTGWVFGGITAVAILAAAMGLLLTALRNHPSADPGRHGERDEDVTRARDAWHDALLERGILPFLHTALTDPDTAIAPHPAEAPAAPAGRMPQLGYDRPGFTSPDSGPAGRRPSYSSPDYSSPDFGGPEHLPE